MNGLFWEPDKLALKADGYAIRHAQAVGATFNKADRL